MNLAELEHISREIDASIGGLRCGKVFPLGPAAMAIDFYPHSGVYLYINVDPGVRAAYLIRRRLKDLERSSGHASPFVITLKKALSGKEVASVSTYPGAKAITIHFVDGEASLVIQIGGKRPNVLLLDGAGTVVTSVRDPEETGQAGDATYKPPSETASPGVVRQLGGRSLSELLDVEERASASEQEFDTAARAAVKRINADIAKRRKLIVNLESDLTSQGNADEWKRKGDLILANISNLRRVGNRVFVTDYFDPEQSEIQIEVDSNVAPTEAAELFFKKYAKARNGSAEIAKRLRAANAELVSLESRKAEIEQAIERRNIDLIRSLVPAKKAVIPEAKRKQKVDELKGVRRFLSSDGFEVLVGKKASDNDHLTFRIARSLDLWLHAADYPGSHVVVRNPNRKEIPNKTLTEAAELAAFYSDARSQAKAAVRYTQKKFVNKPRRSAPGLVSLASFKSVLVQPRVAIKNLNGG
ncbi:MAG: NFACT RNA binding domain-containing protein [Pyrinomonadaceae bacterium]